MSRIIAGSRRGRRLTTPDGPATRPTSDRVREAVFTALVSWLGTVDQDPAETFAGISFLDLYAGSGAVGLEAASRGAQPVLLVERDRPTAELARGNAASTGLDVEVWAGRAEKLASQAAASPYDIIWLDPPYDVATTTVNQTVSDLVARGWLTHNGLVVAERSTRSEALSWPSGIGETWTKRYGETTVHFGMAE